MLDSFWDFDEERIIKEKPEEFTEKRKLILRKVPSVKEVYQFIKALYDCAEFRYKDYLHR